MNWFSKWLLQLSYNHKISEKKLLQETILPSLKQELTECRKKGVFIIRSESYLLDKIDLIESRQLPNLSAEIEAIKRKLEQNGIHFD